MSGRRSRNKGARRERQLKALLRERGIQCEKVPLSGACEGYRGDHVIAGSWHSELKARASGEGFKTLERWLGDLDLLVLWRDRQEPMFLLPLDTFVAMVLGEEGEGQ